jgi:lipopolysaccharide biosynthesis glycosyltransferase
MQESIITIVLSTDDDYIPYLSVCIESIIANTTSQNNYDISILDGGVSDLNKKYICSLSIKNVQIVFVDVSKYINSDNENIFTTTLHFSVATYYRFFLPNLFKNVDKLLYLDCDMVVLRDISELYCIDIGRNYLGATRDIAVIQMVENEMPDAKKSLSSLRSYITNDLGLVDYTDYFQAGCLLFNLKEMRQDGISGKFIKKLTELKTPRYVDQCIMNSVCNGRIHFFEQNWNYTWHIPMYDTRWFNHISKPHNENYKNASEDPYVIHYTGYKTKPMDFPSAHCANYFWLYSRKTLFYEYFIELSKNCKPKKSKRFSKLKYVFLAKITWGNISKKYSSKHK